jgi:hypothetical protein
MQHYDIYLKWNERLFNEMYSAYEAGRAGQDPSLTWNDGELMFFDKNIIPLAKKLDECGVFGVSSDEYLQYALSNRKMWAVQGEQRVQDFLQRIRDKKAVDITRLGPSRLQVMETFRRLPLHVQQ